MTKIQIKNLVPASREDLKLRGLKNTRTEKVLQLLFVDGLGEGHYLLRNEIIRFGLDKRFPFYLKRDFGIKKVNEFIRNT